MTDTDWGTLSNQAIAAAGIVYFLALIAHLVEWSSMRRLPAAAVAGAARTDAKSGSRAEGDVLVDLGPEKASGDEATRSEEHTSELQSH